MGPGFELSQYKKYTGGAFGAGLVLIVLPCLLLLNGVHFHYFSRNLLIGLPILAIFGIMILFGSLSLIAAVFARYGLDNRSQALALPKGSIRAAIALALVVLFTILSIMVYQSVSEPYKIPNLSLTEKDNVVKEPTNRILAIVPQRCTNPCMSDDQLYTVHVLRPSGQESTDLGKQLLILIGTLMTSVTSFYFASRSFSPQSNSGTINQSTTLQHASSVAAPQRSIESHVDGCCVSVEHPTEDKDLPPATGGVA